jgi:hypothetical protein
VRILMEASKRLCNVLLLRQKHIYEKLIRTGELLTIPWGVMRAYE